MVPRSLMMLVDRAIILIFSVIQEPKDNRFEVASGDGMSEKDTFVRICPFLVLFAEFAENSHRWPLFGVPLIHC